MDQTSSSQLRQQDTRRRPGRPRLADSIQPGPDDDMKSKKTRQRLAQRSYRSRKETALASARARTAELEASLNKALQAFHQFQSFVAGRHGQPLPSDVLTQLARTASDMAAISHPSRPVEEDDDKPPSPSETEYVNLEKEWQILDPSLNPLNLRWYENKDPSVPSMAHRFRLACIGRALKLFSLDNPVERWPALGFLSPLVLLELQNPGSLYRLTTIHMGGVIHGITHGGFWADASYTPSVREGLPTMFRTVEGRTDVTVPRVAPPSLQSLRFGQTRTVLRTAIRGLQGEWMESTDVEEYLSERGIYVRQGSPSDRIVLGLPSPDGEQGVKAVQKPRDVVSSRANNMRHIEHDAESPDMHDATIFGFSQGAFTNVPSGTWSFTPSASQYDGLLGMPRLSGSNESSKTGSALPCVTVDIDKLISMLAIEAVCLGPGPGVRRAAVDLAIRESLTVDAL